MKVKNLSQGPIRLVGDEPKMKKEPVIVSKNKVHDFKSKEEAKFYARSINSQYNLGNLEVDGKKKKFPESAEGKKVSTPADKKGGDDSEAGKELAAKREAEAKAAKEKAEKEAKEKAAKEKAEKEAKEKAEKEAKEKAAKEKAAKEKAEKDAKAKDNKGKKDKK